MSEVDTIDVKDALAATQTVATISKLIKTIGLPTDAKSAATDATSVTLEQVLKQISASVQILTTDVIPNGASSLTPKFAKISVASSGDNTLVAAVTSKKIRVLAYNIMASAGVNAKFQSGAAGTDLTGLKYFDAAGSGICAPFNPAGWFETATATLLNINLSAAITIGGELVYVEV